MLLHEVFFVYEWPEGPYPGDAELFNEIAAICLDEFEGYVGTSFETSSIDFSYVTPDPTGWEDGERVGLCTLFDMDGKLTGSAHNSGG